jgi:hypothetical protein
MTRKPIDRLRSLCLSLPDTTEVIAWGAPTFRVRGKMFAMFADNHHGDGRVAAWCKAPPGEQELMVEADPDRYFVPPYVGTSGWVGVRLETGIADWTQVKDILAEGHRLAAPAPRRAAPTARRTTAARPAAAPARRKKR